MRHMDDVMMNEQQVPKDSKLPKVTIMDQPYTDKFSLDEALKKGTLFPNLYDPYMVSKHY
ncbi:MAG TPA: spore coat associated protein CotJA [Clostridiales bacterium]|nr:MAG: hypothetical protein A2Y18_03680 [Clostridiales bacterium GWD2_32_19]HCC08225.1 spore coat associated protein CotJA [Clostridiales bacterium]